MLEVNGKGQIISKIQYKTCRNNEYMCWFDVRFGNLRKRAISFGETAKYILANYEKDNNVQLSGRYDRFKNYENINIKNIEKVE